MENKKTLLTKNRQHAYLSEDKQSISHLAEIKRLRMENLPIPTKQGFELVDINKIYFLQAEGNYTIFYFENNATIRSSKELGFYEEALKREAFVRVHHSNIVNLNKVARYVKADDGYLVLTNKQVVQVSRAKKETLMNIFKRFNV